MASITTIRSGNLEARVSSLGAELQGLALEGTEYLWQGDERWWPRRSPVLFPTVGCLPNDEATSAAGPVHLKRHGLARIYEHEVVEAGEDHVRYQLESSPETLAAFPFDFRLNMTYALADGRLEQRFEVTNTGERDLPFQLGGHPAFSVPVAGTDEAYEDYELRFAEPWDAVSPGIGGAGLYDWDTMLTVFEGTDVLPVTHELFEKYLTVTLMDVPGRTITLAGTKSGHGLQVDFPGFDYLGLWSAEGRAPFVAIEPWCGCASAATGSRTFEDKRGLQVIAPGETFVRSFFVRPF